VRFGEVEPPAETGKEQSRKEFVPSDSDEGESTGSEEEEEPHSSNQQKQISHIKELIADVEQQVQFAQEEQEVVNQDANNEHRLHNLAEYRTLLEWLDERRELLQRLLYFTELFHKSIRQWNAAVRRKDTARIIHYVKQRGENRQHVEILERNVTEHQKRVPSVTVLPEKTGTGDEGRPSTPQRGRTWSVPGGFVQSPEYQRIRGVEPPSETQRRATGTRRTGGPR
jgi:hypothetical protein